MTHAPVLAVKDLVLRYRTGRGLLTAVDHIDLDIAAGETVALIGESGCGKTSLGKSIVRLVKPAGGTITFEGTDLAPLSARQLRPLRRGIQMVFQDPLAALDPRHRAHRIVETPLALHNVVPRRHRAERVRELFDQVGLPTTLHDRLPHQLSGGQRQRLNIARALATEPRLLICDEPVSALDVTLQAQVLALLQSLQERLGVAYLFISHDISVVQSIAQRIAIMYLGKIVEVLPAHRLWQDAAHPYTKLLLDSVPGRSPSARRLGNTTADNIDLPSPYALPTGCRFQSRCPHVVDTCRHSEPALQSLDNTHWAACHFVRPTPSTTHSH